MALGLPFWEPVLEQMLTYGEPLRGNDLWSMHYLALGASALIATAGIGAGFAFYAPSWPVIGKQSVPVPLRRRFKPEHVVRSVPGRSQLPRSQVVLRRGLQLPLRPSDARRGAVALRSFDKLIVDGLVNSAAWLTALTSRLSGLGDKLAIDGLVNLIARSVYELGGWGRCFRRAGFGTI